jgi:hypothetical protein
MSNFELEGGGIELSFTRDWCAQHLEPFRHDWPSAAAGIALVLLFDAFVQDPRVLEMAPKDKNGLADSSALGRLVSECAPLCCFLGDEIVAQIVAEARAGEGPRLDEIKRRRHVL